jgi:LacI family transcriptional regulator
LSQSLSIDNKRMQGYLEALTKYDLPKLPNRVIRCSNDDKQNYRKIKALLSSKKRPDGIFASVEKLAITAYEVCRELHIRIPDDLKVICFSNLATATLLSPSLTTITQPAFDMGKVAASLLFRYLDKNKTFIPNENIILKSSLHARESTKS